MKTIQTKPAELALLSIVEVTQRVGLSRSTLLKEMYTGRLRSVKVGARRLVHPDDLSAWIDRLREQPDEAA